MRLLALAVRFRARRSFSFPQGGAANAFRGAFGKELRARDAASYQRLFAPHQSPRPIVFRAHHLNGAALHAGDEFVCNFHLFDLLSLDICLATLARLRPDDWEHLATIVEQRDVPLTAPEAPVRWVRLTFVTPTELKHRGALAGRPDFPILWARVRERIDNLSQFYGSGPLPFDWKSMAGDARTIEMPDCEITRVESSRWSASSGARHPISGFIGGVTYRGELTNFLPFLQAAQWTGAGRYTVWGNGAIHVSR